MTHSIARAVGRIAAIALLAGAPALAAEDAIAPSSGPHLRSIFDSFYNVELDTARSLPVNDLVITRDVLKLTLEQGVLHLAEPIEGRITGAYFAGRGTMRLKPPSGVARKALKRKYGRERIEEAFTELMLRFNDDTDRELQAATTPAPAGDRSPSSTWKARSRIQFNSDDLQLDFIESLFSPRGDPRFFVADMKTSRGWISFNFRHRQRIEIGVFRERVSGTAGKRLYEPWCAFHRRQEYDNEGNHTLLPEADAKDSAALRDVTMTVEIPNTRTVRIDAALQIEALVDGLQSVRFDFINNLAGSWRADGRPVNIDRVTGADGAALPFLHAWHQLIVLLPRPLVRGERTVIRVTADEDTIIQLTPKSYWIFTTYSWFPQIGYNGGRYTFDWTVKVAQPMRAAGSGDLVREWEEGKLNCGRWRSATPVQFPSFIFGEFETTDGVYTRDGPDGGEVALRLYSIRGSSVAVRGRKDNILFNIQQGLKHYEAIFGPYPYGDLDVTQMATGLGFAQSPPGILFLSGLLQGGGGGSRVDQVIFHELAHQWWGNQVGWIGDEDAWISESWAEYAAGLIIEGIDPDKFRTMLDEWRQDAEEADDQGTIATAYHSAARTELLYGKGPYVLHMLRTWMGWEKFTTLTRTLQSKYKNRNINTDTVARETGALMGYDMFPFFDQWIRDQGIPRLHYSWSAEQSGDGKFIISMRVRQEDSENFKYLMVPISLDFGSGDPVVILKPILEPDTVIRVKVPSLPKKVVFDDQSTQLATFIEDRHGRRR